jgi:hypothetical protein
MPSLAVLLDSSGVEFCLTCPKCSGPMVLTCTKPSRIGFEMRVFDGVNCDHFDKVVTETYSMKWMCSGLRAPV